MPSDSSDRDLCLLIIDDNETVLKVSKALLEEEGVRVHSSDNAREGIEIYAAHCEEIDIVLLDLVMPEMSGAEIFRRLKEIKEDVKIIVTSGYGVNEFEKRLEGVAPAGFLQKPFKRAELMQKIREVLSGADD